MRFECNCTKDRLLVKMLNEVHSAKTGWNFEIRARLWYTADGSDKTIMVEHQIATQDCRDITENPDEPDWFTAYEVDDENDYDCSKELFTEPCDNYISVSGLKNEMCEFAQRVFERCYGLDAKLVVAKEKSEKSLDNNFGKEAIKKDNFGIVEK